jgi:hypothetical protein
MSRQSRHPAAVTDWQETNPGYQVGQTRRLSDGSIEIDAGRIADSWTALREHYARCGVPHYSEGAHPRGRR